MYNLQNHQRPIALIPCLYGGGMLKIPWVNKSVGSVFLSTNCCAMMKTRLFSLILDRQSKSSGKELYHCCIIVSEWPFRHLVYWGFMSIAGSSGISGWVLTYNSEHSLMRLEHQHYPVNTWHHNSIRIIPQTSHPMIPSLCYHFDVTRTSP